MNNKKIKLILYPVLYWIVLIITPFIVAFLMRRQTQDYNLMGLVTLYILFIAPFLYFIPYILVRPGTTKKKIFFIIFGLIIPYIIIYLYIYIGLIRTFENSNFPF